jgi:hypothetical protein
MCSRQRRRPGPCLRGPAAVVLIGWVPDVRNESLEVRTRAVEKCRVPYRDVVQEVALDTKRLWRRGFDSGHVHPEQCSTVTRVGSMLATGRQVVSGLRYRLYGFGAIPRPCEIQVWPRGHSRVDPWSARLQRGPG